MSSELLQRMDDAIHSIVADNLQICKRLQKIENALFEGPNTLLTAPDLTGFGARLKALRKQHNLTQHDLAIACNCQTCEIVNYEHGSKYPRLERFVSFVSELHTSADYLLGRTFNQSPPEIK